jgi:hypothetical protein
VRYYPEVHDGYDRLGMVYEARGDQKQAADYYRKVIDYVRAHTDQYESGFKDTFYRLIQKLDLRQRTDSRPPTDWPTYARGSTPRTSFNSIKNATVPTSIFSRRFSAIVRRARTQPNRRVTARLTGASRPPTE